MISSLIRAFHAFVSIPWNVSTATYASLSKSVLAQAGNPRGLAFSSDGTKMYIADNGTAIVFQYTLSTAWNVSTATYASLSKALTNGGQDIGLYFSPDGTKMYHGNVNSGGFSQYTLSTPWNVSTASFFATVQVSAQDTDKQGFAFSSDGTKMFIIGNTNKTVFQYTLSTPWNVSTATYASLSKLVSSQDTTPFGLAFSSDGTKMFITGSTTDTVFQYTLSIPWNVSTATYASLSKSVLAQDASPADLAFSSDGTKMFIMGNATDTVYQYTL